MSQVVEVPLWLLILILLFAAVTFASHFLFPSVRWFFRKRAERVIARVNKRLARPIEPFKIARRYDMIQRLIYDPEVAKAISEQAALDGIPENVAFEDARRYAREIVPSFSATLYFTIGGRLAQWVSRSMFRIRLGAFDRDRLEALDANATLVFIVNHRSNMDYFLVTYLMSRASALSFAVGEWARIWPLSGIIRSMGAFFIRRRSRGVLYRRVLARYVQMAAEGGVTQVIFPEGGLTLTGRLAPPKLGLLSYIVSDWQPQKRDVIFVPVAVNYDRVLEDFYLIAAHKAGVRKFKPPLREALSIVFKHIWQRVSFRLRKFGTASVAFGEPLALTDFLKGRTGDQTEAVAEELMRRIEAVMPVLPVPLVARALLAGVATKAEIEADVAKNLASLVGQGVILPRRDATKIAEDAIEILTKRKLIAESGDAITLEPASEDTLAFYAASIVHHFDADAANSR